MDPASDTADLATPAKAKGAFVVTFCGLVLSGNLGVVAMAWLDQSWTALGLLVYGGPVVNGALMAFGVLAIPYLRRDPARFSFVRHIVLVVGAPVAAAAFDTVAILSMDLHGG